jgi:hypothetical protein
MKVKVFHTAFETTPVHIATVAAPEDCDSAASAAEYAYRWTQNIMDSWSRKMPGDGNDRVTVEVPVEEYGHRSSAMGDYFEVDGELLKCAAVGFEAAKEIECRQPF